MLMLMLFSFADIYLIRKDTFAQQCTKLRSSSTHSYKVSNLSALCIFRFTMVAVLFLLLPYIAIILSSQRLSKQFD